MIGGHKMLYWPRFALLVLALTLAGCASAGGEAAEEEVMEYLEALGEIEAGGDVLEPGGEAERRAVAAFRALLSDFKAPDFRQRVREVYAERLYFNDTLKTIRSVAELEEYLGATGDNLESGTVEFQDLVVQDGNYYFRWQMSLRFKRFDRGRLHRSVGMSHIRFDGDGKVVLHQDFWDSAGGLFEHVPVLGWMIRRAKRRL